MILLGGALVPANLVPVFPQVLSSLRGMVIEGGLPGPHLVTTTGGSRSGAVSSSSASMIGPNLIRDRTDGGVGVRL
ncbi:hypothetical protein F2Q69_00048299 [Brassica cretica]|uniref:AT-hook motif nuclear-localized protein n=2 Tax=Brassica cretica TaxID=69181 RepID=A0ABQ7B3I4_BRACR|nr:hypothetical protein DY000_02060800 [Brassica cretica]KAF3525061.1 hypothetical protein F2Q69_00048299 [Brassica cretica]